MISINDFLKDYPSPEDDLLEMIGEDDPILHPGGLGEGIRIDPMIDRINAAGVGVNMREQFSIDKILIFDGIYIYIYFF